MYVYIYIYIYVYIYMYRQAGAPDKRVRSKICAAVLDADLGMSCNEGI